MNKLLHWDINEIAYWPRRLQCLMFCGVGLVCFAIIGWSSVLPKFHMLNQAKQQELSVNHKINQLEQHVVTWQAMKNKLAATKGQAEQFEKLLFSDYAQASVVEEVNQSGLDYDLTFKRIRWGERQTDEGYIRQKLHLELQGDYHAIGHFMAALAQRDYLMVFDKVGWYQHSTNTSQLQWRAQAELYQPTQPSEESP